MAIAKGVSDEFPAYTRGDTTAPTSNGQPNARQRPPQNRAERRRHPVNGMEVSCMRMHNIRLVLGR